MLDIVTSILTTIKQISPILLLGIGIATGVGLFGGDELIGTLGLSEVRNEYRSYLGGTFVLAVSVLAAQGLAAAGRLVSSKLEKRRERERAREALAQKRERLHSLTPDEKAYLIPFILGEQNTLYFSIQDGVAGGLVAKGILYQSSNIGTMLTGFAHNIQPWAREYLAKNPQLLSGANPSPNGPPRW